LFLRPSQLRVLLNRIFHLLISEILLVTDRLDLNVLLGNTAICQEGLRALDTASGVEGFIASLKTALVAWLVGTPVA
jgi:hypothetical protein